MGRTTFNVPEGYAALYDKRKRHAKKLCFNISEYILELFKIDQKENLIRKKG